MDSRFRGNDENGVKRIFYESIMIGNLKIIAINFICDKYKISCKSHLASFRRKPESSLFNAFWTPASAGVTASHGIREFCKSLYRL